MVGMLLRRSGRLAAKRQLWESQREPPRKKHRCEETEEQRRQRQHRVRKRRWEEVNNQRNRAINLYEQKLEAEQKQQRCLGPVVHLEDEPPPKLYKGPGERALDRIGRFVEAIRRQLEREQELSATGEHTAAPSACSNTRTDDGESVSDEDGEAAEISQPAQQQGHIEVQSESPPITEHLEVLATGGHTACTWPYMIVRAENIPNTGAYESDSDLSQPAEEQDHIEVQSESPPITEHLEETVIELKNWRPVIRNGRLCVEGERGDRRRRLPYVTPPVTRVRKGDKRLVTVTGGVKFRLIGDVGRNVHDVPEHIWGKFRGGIPRYWQGVAEHLAAAECSLSYQPRKGYNLRPRR